MRNSDGSLRISCRGMTVEYSAGRCSIWVLLRTLRASLCPQHVQPEETQSQRAINFRRDASFLLRQGASFFSKGAHAQSRAIVGNGPKAHTLIKPLRRIAFEHEQLDMPPAIRRQG